VDNGSEIFDRHFPIVVGDRPRNLNGINVFPGIRAVRRNHHIPLIVFD
jgi:hypothetical protein